MLAIRKNQTTQLETKMFHRVDTLLKRKPNFAKNIKIYEFASITGVTITE